MQGYKITDNKRTRRYGVGVNSLEMLKKKAQLKFSIINPSIYNASDGVEVADEHYFSSLPAQSLFIIAGPCDIVTTEEEFEMEKLRESSALLRVADIINEFASRSPKMFQQLIAKYEKNRSIADNKTKFSLKTEHTEWFLGQEERCQTKEEAMCKRAQDRMRGYFYKTKDELTRNLLYRKNAQARNIIDSILEKFRYLLISCDYFSMIFDRKHTKRHKLIKNKEDEETDARLGVLSKRIRQDIRDYNKKNKVLDEWTVSLCNEMGVFFCQGPFSEDKTECVLEHTINPYQSRENFILFQIWNLDHQIELSRSIVPGLLHNVSKLIEKPYQKCLLHKRRAIDVSVLEYFLEIFSLKNLKLVHIVCHEKSQRVNKSEGHLICDFCSDYKIVQELLVTANDQ